MTTVLHVNDYGELGGAEALVGRLIELQTERGFRSELFTIDDVAGHRRTALSYVANYRAAVAFAARVDRSRPDVIHFHNFYHELSPLLLCVVEMYRQEQETAVVMTCHDHHLLCPNPGMTWFDGSGRRVADPERLKSISYLLSRRWDERGWGRSALRVAQHLWNYRVRRRRAILDAVLAPSRAMTEALATTGLPAEWAPNPAPGWSPVEKAGGDRLRLVFAGRVEPEKGLAAFLAHSPSDVGFHLTVVGDGSEFPLCRSIVSERGMGEAVTFVGRRSQAETRRLIGDAHALVMPSLVPEAAGLSALEAIAAGTSVLVPKVGGAAEIVADSGIGMVFDPADPGSVRSAVQDLATAVRAGTLNAFDASAFLSGRSEDRWVSAISAMYVRGADKIGDGDD